MNSQTQDRSALDRLKQGVARFQSAMTPEQAQGYSYAATHPQQPHTLFITCADSRIDVERLTSSGVGEVFITRNVGNVVPRYHQPLEGVAAVIEYAVKALKVKHVVVCGHSDCGAMKALLNPDATTQLPAVRHWLENTPGAAPVVSGADQLRNTTEGNVLAQVENLKTHPSVVDAMAEGNLTVSGWVYDIGSGAVCIAADGKGPFEPLAQAGESERGA